MYLGGDFYSAPAVYIKDGSSGSRKFKYAGITSREPQIRFDEHLRAVGTGRETLQYRVMDGATNLTRNQARIIEQLTINKYGFSHTGGQLLNKINSIVPQKWGQFGITFIFPF